MKKFLSIILAGLMLTVSGCGIRATTTTPPTALAPNYLTPDDQTLGKDLKALREFYNNESINNYPKLSVATQKIEGPILNILATAINTAEQSYKSFHAGSATLTQAQADYNAAVNAQNNLITAKQGVK